MIFKIDVDKWGSFFSVPCSVAQQYLKISNGDFIKVLLCVLAGGSPNVDTTEISKLSAIDEEVVEEALLHWNSLGVITIKGKEQARIKQYSEQISVQTDTVSEAHKPHAEKKTAIRYSPSDLLRLAESSEDIRMMFAKAEQALSRTISATEQAALVEIHEYYGFPVASVILLTQYCSSIGKDSMAYIRRVATDWHEKSIIQPRDVELEVIRLTEYHSFENEVKRALGLTAKTTDSQRKHFEKWRANDISVELIELAGDMSIDNTNNHTINLRYMDKILSAWNDAGIKTVKQVQRLSDEKQQKQNGRDNKSSAKSYDIDEFESFIKGYTPKLSDKT